MVGNFNPNELLCMGASEAVYAAAYANAEIAGLDGGYVMMPGCDLAAPDTIGKYFGHGQGLFRLRGQRQKLSGEAAWRKTFGTLT